jgi:hypothetical protein
MAEQPQPAASAIEIRIEKVSQLFHSLDPFPFREKDLDKEAEEFIVSWARELPSDSNSRSSFICRTCKHHRPRPVN